MYTYMYHLLCWYAHFTADISIHIYIHTYIYTHMKNTTCTICCCNICVLCVRMRTHNTHARTHTQQTHRRRPPTDDRVSRRVNGGSIQNGSASRGGSSIQHRPDISVPRHRNLRVCLSRNSFLRSFVATAGITHTAGVPQGDSSAGYGMVWHVQEQPAGD